MCGLDSLNSLRGVAGADIRSSEGEGCLHYEECEIQRAGPGAELAR